MAKSQYEYVKQFELPDACLPHCWIVCRIDGVAFTKFTAAHSLVKPNDARARDLMNSAARAVMQEYTDICIAYGVSDEYSFVLQPKTDLYSRRASRVVCYPTDESVKDYLRWRQVDCHINNLYNTCFWKLVHRYQQENPAWTEKEARDRAHAEMNSKYASSSAKNDLLHDAFACNYNDEEAAWRKGSILLWKETTTNQQQQQQQQSALVDVADESSESHDASFASSPSSSPADAATATSSSASSSSLTTSAAASSESAATASVPGSSAAAPATVAAGPSKLKRCLVLLHCDLISDTFYTAAHVGVIPYLTWSDAKKRQRADEKKRKKDEHRRREKEGTEAQRPSGTTDERKNESAEHGRSPEAAATTATGAPQ